MLISVGCHLLFFSSVSCLSDSTIMSIFFALIIKRHSGHTKDTIERRKMLSLPVCFRYVMATTEVNLKSLPMTPTSAPSSPQPTTSPLLLALPPPPPSTASLTPTTSSPSTPSPFYDDNKPIEKCYKKEKQILFEFDQTVKGKDKVYKRLLDIIIINSDDRVC